MAWKSLLILTSDKHILSGHRRALACHALGWKEVPCRIKAEIRREGMSAENYMRLLAEYNPQRIKTVDAMLKETFLHTPSVSENDIRDTEGRNVALGSTFRPTDAPEYIAVKGTKGIDPIGSLRQEFLSAAIEVVNRLKEFWPLNIRQIHYQLLNDPPLKNAPKRSQFTARQLEAKHRYINNNESYQALSRLCTSARYLNFIPFEAIDDATRVSDGNAGFDDVREFIEHEIKYLLTGYVLDRQRPQPIHIECYVEKNTLLGIVRAVCKRYSVPLTSGRGYAGPSIWYKMAMRFKQSGKRRMVLLIASDFDPEGLELADDAIRSLRDLWKLPVDYCRIAVNRDQIDAFGLSEDFNPAKVSSARFKSFVERTGDSRTWECEALPPEYLRDQLEESIRANMNLEIYEKTLAQEERDVESIKRIKNELSRYFVK